MPVYFIGLPLYSSQSSFLILTHSSKISSFKDFLNYLKEIKVGINIISQCETLMLESEVHNCKSINCQLDSIAITCILLIFNIYFYVSLCFINA